MAYITYDQYIEYFGQPTITAEEFPIYANIATDLIDSITADRITEQGGLEAFPVLIQTLITKACGAQVMFLAENGVETVATGQTGAGFTVGKVRVDGNSTGSNSRGDIYMSGLCMIYLERTGLMYRSVPMHGDYIC